MDDAEKVAGSGAAGAGRKPAAATRSQQPSTPQRFEDAYARLEVLVAEMERGDLPLEELLSRFEEGVALVRHCSAFLSGARARVEQYIEQKDGHWVLRELDS